MAHGPVSIAFSASPFTSSTSRNATSCIKRTSLVFQSYHLIDNLTVFENLEVPLSYKNVPHKERVSLVCDTLDRFHIVGKKDLFPNQLSGGSSSLWESHER